MATCSLAWQVHKLLILEILSLIDFRCPRSNEQSVLLALNNQIACTLPLLTTQKLSMSLLKLLLLIIADDVNVDLNGAHLFSTKRVAHRGERLRPITPIL